MPPHRFVREYRRWNACIGGVLFFLLIFTAAAIYLLQKPCLGVKMSGQPCILCGCTRDFLLILHGKNAVHNPISLPLFVGLLAEFCWRIAAGVMPERKMKGCFAGDVIGHIVFCSCLVVLLISRRAAP